MAALKAFIQKWWIRMLLGLAAVLAVAWCGLHLLPARGCVPGVNPFRMDAVTGRPLVIAHAGGSGLAPENTLPAFEVSAALGCDALEADLRLSKDGVLVTHHDATIDRTSPASGTVAELTLAELKALNFGYHYRDAQGNQPWRGQPARLATVDELFERFPTRLLVLELKDRGTIGRAAAGALAAAILRHQGTRRTMVASFDEATLAAFRAAAPSVLTSTSRSQTKTMVLLNLVGLDTLAAGTAAGLQVPVASSGFRLDRPRLIRAAHRRNWAVHFWTINDPEEMRRLIGVGADGLITDRPDLLIRVLGELGYRTRP